MPADLHIHTTCSDGTYTPEQIVKVAKKVGLTTVAITDHDTTAGVAPALSAGAALGVTVIPGVELTTRLDDMELHLLGYYIDFANEEFQSVLQKLKDARRERISLMCDKLKNLGVNIKAREVMREAKNECPGRPHVARVLVKFGFCNDLREAFQKYLATGGPAYVEHYKLTPKEAIALVRKVGGIPVLGHPAGIVLNNMVQKIAEKIPHLAAEGLLGIEAFYPVHSATQTKEYVAMAEKYGLLVTGGSDFHGEGGVRKVIFGEFALDDNYVDALRKIKKDLG
ncbi:MAG: PHP domain-containing protein [Candidatus Margulisiibacteriota bacterium]